MRAGTTALHEVLGAHPDIFMSPFKEPAFFADPEQLARDSRIIASAGYAGNRERYLGLFAEAEGARYRGESSSHYTKQPRLTGIARRMAAFSSDPRIIYLVRNPIERALSHYQFAVYRRDEHRRPLAAFQADPFYCAVSDFEMQITPYLETFGRDHVHIEVLEELSAQPGHALAAIFTWLGVDPGRGPDTMPRRNQFTRPVDRLRGPRLVSTASHTAWYRGALSRLLPSAVRNAAKAVLRDPVDDDLRSDAVMEHLRRRLEEPTRRLETLMGRSIDAWGVRS